MNQKSVNKYKPVSPSVGFSMLIKGALIGIANIIPGVSGGTFALILGIYERLLDALHEINLAFIIELLKSLFTFNKPHSRKKFFQLLQKIDFLFLCCLGIGAVTTILGLSFLIDYLLVNHPGLTLSFFVGLIIPSIVIPWKMMTGTKKPLQLFFLIPGIMLTVGVSLAFGQVGTSTSLLWSFLTGAIAISAMILPGISGSFVLLVMGQYQNILRSLQDVLKSFDISAIIWLGVFAVGCVFGLLMFARLLGYLLKHKRNATLAFLIGLILGSFWVLWPFKVYDAKMNLDHIDKAFQQRVKEKQDIRVATAPNCMPDDMKEALFNLLAMGIGIVGALGMNRLGNEESE